MQTVRSGKILKKEIDSLKQSNQTLSEEVKSMRVTVQSHTDQCSSEPQTQMDSKSFAQAVSTTVAPMVRSSVQSVLREEQHKNEVIVSKVEEKGEDNKAMSDLCQTMNFEPKPTEVKRLGKKKDGHKRLLKVSFTNHFEARAFRARVEEMRKGDTETIPKWRMRTSRTKEEQTAFAAKHEKVFKLNEEAKAANSGESFSLREDGSVWKFIKQENGHWKRDQSWSFNNSGNE